ncbi:aromatic ring-hydroxylating oxygenase subunit alpha [Asticcacaulis benevestitus]|nr:aromatic ring-hydroxylating dioxygenase subunit alpha [Asticcacaulis benevestitus]
MKSPLGRPGYIQAASYGDADVLRLELDHIFKSSWLCVGFANDLQNHNDFITFQVGPHSLVVQNFKGVLKAFRNVCSHRFSRLQTEPCGNRALTCPYHGWRYDGEGRPVGIPQNETAFGLVDSDRAALALESYEMDTVGHFVFVRMNSPGPSLKAFLGEAWEALAHVSDICVERIEQISYEVGANWKLGVENGIEAYHHPLVHSDTFSNVLQQDILMNVYGPHCTHEGALTARSRRWWDTIADKARLELSDRQRDYVSFLIFPNVVTTFTAGALFTFQTLTPINASRFRLNSSSWLAAGSGAARPLVIGSLNAFSARVRDEDLKICEIAQSGVAERGIDRPPFLGEVDNRVRHFQAAYAERMEAQHV